MSAPSGRSILGGFIVAAVCAAIGTAFVYVGSPGEARRRRFDERRVTDLNEIARNLDSYWRTNARLPAALGEAVRGGTESVPCDPESGEPYAYRAIDGRHYEICATFAGASHEVPAMFERPFRRHGAGRQCFTVEAQGFR
jgi:hypothetical protein